jgi:hypothetical protein
MSYVPKPRAKMYFLWFTIHTIWISYPRAACSKCCTFVTSINTVSRLVPCILERVSLVSHMHKSRTKIRFVCFILRRIRISYLRASRNKSRGCTYLESRVNRPYWAVTNVLDRVPLVSHMHKSQTEIRFLCFILRRIRIWYSRACPDQASWSTCRNLYGGCSYAPTIFTKPQYNNLWSIFCFF